MFKGVLTALITPLTKNGEIDEQKYADFIEWQIAEGVHGLVPSGTTGESPTLSHDEHGRVIEICIDVAKGRVPVMAGTGSNSTKEAISLTQHAEKAGAEGALIAMPYYNKPTQEGLYQHFKALHDATEEIELFIYNIPGRSVVDMSDATIARLSELPRIVGLKDATGDLSRPLTLRQSLGARKDSFIQLSGEDATMVAFNMHGGTGVISVSANIAPKAVAEVQNATLSGDYAKAFELHEKLMPLHSVLFCETSPIPVKYAASLMGKCDETMRLPLVSPQEENKAQLQSVLEALKLI
jgi:4-hydroxy-tetrahydrodipicolinate synthase